MDSGDGHMSKKFRNDSSTAVRAGGRESADLDHKVPPSPVIHVRGLPEHVTDNDLRQAVTSFGAVSYVMQIPNRNMGLIEFESVESATALVNYTQSHSLSVAGRSAQFNYSTSTRIKRPDGNIVTQPNVVILISVSNARHPITVEVINAICSPYGNVLRIVIFRKNGVQAMVEFDNVSAATQAKNSLNGQDIYSGCCTIKAEYAKPVTLNVKRNEGDTWDFTYNQNFARDDPSNDLRHQPLLAEPRYGAGPLPFANYGGDMSRRQPNYGPGPGAAPVAAVQYPMQGQGYQGQGYQGQGYQGQGYQGQGYQGQGYQGQGYQGQGYQAMQYGSGGGYTQPGQDTHDGDSASYPTPGALLTAYESQSVANASGSNPSCVLMVYGMDPVKFNCQRVFNLLCIYGNVIKVKFLKTKEGSAMVQMGDRDACERVIHNLNGAPCFGNRLSISLSKQVFLQDVTSPHELPDGTSAYGDFVGSRNQRYVSPEAAAKNRPVAPTSSLYFFNAPPGISELDLRQIIDELDVCPPEKICVFPPKSEKSSRGLMQWRYIENCTEALACANHYQIPHPAGGKSPFVLKMAFSQSAVE